MKQGDQEPSANYDIIYWWYVQPGDCVKHDLNKH